MNNNDFGSYILKSLLILISYYGFSLLVKPLITPPFFASPIWPAAGIAVGAILLWGYRFIPAVLVAEFITNFEYYEPSALETQPDLIATYIIFLVAALIRCTLSVFLVRKYIGPNNSYTNFTSIALLYILAGVIPAFISACISTFGLSLSQEFDLISMTTNIITWWLGDTIGIFIFLPLMLMLFKKPKSVWFPRFIKSILPITISFLLLMFLAANIIKIEKQNIRDYLESDAKLLMQNGFFHEIKNTGYNLESKQNIDRDSVLNEIFLNKTEQKIKELELDSIEFEIIENLSIGPKTIYKSEVKKNKGLFWSLTSQIGIFEDNWHIIAKATPEYIHNKSSWFLWWLLSLGFLFIAFLTAGLLVLTGNTMLIEQQVNKRTNEINSLNKFLKESEDKYKQLIEIQPVVFWRYYLGDNVLNFLSNEAVNMLEYPRETLIKLDEIWNKLIHEDDRTRVYNEFNKGLASKERFIITYRAISRSGNVLWLKDYVSTRKVHNRLELVGLKVDVTQEQEKENKIKQLAYYDTMTKLPNHLKFMDYLKTAIDVAVKNNLFGAVIFLDLDRFKILNDSMGHNFGDKLLIEISRRLKKLLNDKYVPSRFGGDEFVILFDNKDKSIADIKTSVRKMAESIQFVIKQPFMIDSHTFYTSCSIGISIFPHNSNQADEIIQQADTAMYVSKGNRDNPISFFNISMKKDASNLLSMEKSLKEAIENDEFVMYYQPIFDKNKQIQGVESLIRWNHPEKGLMSPDSFILIAEETGIIHELGRWIIDTIFKQVKKWQKDKLKILPVSINISLLQFKSTDLINHLEYCITKYNLDPQLITLELTESIAVEDYSSALNKLNKLKEIGFKIALDDFGTGYSSLNYLANLPFDILKIDKSFTNKIGEKSNSDTLIETIVLMAKKLELSITVEGVETLKQFEYLVGLGCEKYQGYLVSKPLPILSLNKLVNPE